MNQPPDDDLRQWLREQGDDVARHAPAFQRVWRAASEAQAVPTQASSPLKMYWVLAALAVVLVGTIIALLIPQPDKIDTPKQEIVTQTAPLTDDTFNPSAPTDFLLADPRDAAPSVDQLSHEINALLKP